MYRYLDRPVGALEPRERMLLWAMRKWVLAVSAGRCPCATLVRAFQEWRIEGSLANFALVMFMLNTKGQTRLLFGMPCAPQVGDDEARLLALFDAGASRAPELVGRLAGALVTPDASRDLAIAVELMSGALTAASPLWEPSRLAGDGR